LYPETLDELLLDPVPGPFFGGPAKHSGSGAISNPETINANNFGRNMCEFLREMKLLAVWRPARYMNSIRFVKLFANYW